ncbi:hypothetical protein PGB90_001577 [Kerria lacca]
MVDYSKWKDIEISDDEDETHPNIDTPSLFRWRHQARVERMEERRKEKEAIENRKMKHKKLYNETLEKLHQLKVNGEDTSNVQDELTKLKMEAEEIKRQEEELKHKDKVTPWNVDTISQPGFTKTVVNKSAPRYQKELSEEEKDTHFKIFVKENESLIKQYGMLKKYDDSKRFLQEHSQLVCEESANYLVFWCINLEIDEKHNLMEHVAHQAICLQFILELSKVMDIDPRGCVSSFFTRIQMADERYKIQFKEELQNLKIKIVQRAQDKLDATVREIEESERQKRLGPGGLDPVEVYESLPSELQKCFDLRDIPLLQETIAKMAPEEATYYMKRCVDSGLWVPDEKKNNKQLEDTSSENTHSDTNKEL